MGRNRPRSLARRSAGLLAGFACDRELWEIDENLCRADLTEIERLGPFKSRLATYCLCEGGCPIVRTGLPALLVTALVCTFAGPMVRNALAQSDPATMERPIQTDPAATEKPIQSERRVNPGLAPPMPCFDGLACCDHPDMAYLPRCLEWQPKYERWRRAFDAYHRG